jgi:quercetin dioxygenase-like cupin family protein
MPWQESNRWLQGDKSEQYYQKALNDAEERPRAKRLRKRILKPWEMPWEMAPQGILKHLINSEMNTLMETVDAYMQVIPPGSRSGKHRHLAEECLYVLEGQGYDFHTDCDVEITDTYHWTPQKEGKQFDWSAGDVVYVPPNTIHQHFNASGEKPARLISATNRIYKFSGLNDLEQIENAPEYIKGMVLDSQKVEELLRKGKILAKEIRV